MRTVKAIPITQEAFAPFGQFYHMNKPSGYPLCGEIHQFSRTDCLQTATTEWGILPF